MIPGLLIPPNRIHFFFQWNFLPSHLASSLTPLELRGIAPSHRDKLQTTFHAHYAAPDIPGMPLEPCLLAHICMQSRGPPHARKTCGILYSLLIYSTKNNKSNTIKATFCVDHQVHEHATTPLTLSSMRDLPSTVRHRDMNTPSERRFRCTARLC